ncbi:MAG: ATP-binding protein [Campylobacterota bacterium]|nr:ATP-binding protein [Campylobacterota bacterium]
MDSLKPTDLDFTQPITIAPHIHWIGMYLENDPFQCHPYLIENGDESILVDPGSMLEFDAVVRKVQLITPLKNIKYIILHHQDPDLCASVPTIEKLIDRSDLLVITHSRMVPLVKHYLIKSDYYEIDKNSHRLMTDNGLQLKFLTTPYCHSPGAFVTYEPESKTLFSGDIFGGIEESWEFFAKEDYFEKARQFHAEYMPSKDIFNYALSKIEKLDMELIAPQHGSIIQKPYIADLIGKMKGLDCGLYIEQKYNDELIDIIHALQQKDEALKERETLLFQQSKMAEIGEMIANIAHQWRQPLAIINTIVAIAKEKNQLELLNKEELAKKLEEMEKNIIYMSTTIEDFMNFFRPDKIKNEFSIRKAVSNALHILSASLNENRIDIKIEGDHSLVVNGYLNEYTQVILTILSNAQDALLHSQVSEPKISITFYKHNGKTILEIADNARGIPDENIGRIFDPYFTTKHQSIGTGLGLYIAKMIIEKSMGGSLHATNTPEGAKFIIGVPHADPHQ